MRTPFLLAVLCGGAVCASTSAKPPKKSTPDPTPTATAAPTSTPVPANESPTPGPSFPQQNGGKDAVSLPLADVIHTAAGKSVLPVDPANPGDAAMIAKIGGVMDRILPGMNRPTSPAHVVNRLDEVVDFFEDALGAFNKADAARGFPAVRLVDPAGKSYYVGVTLYPTGGRDAAVRALRFDPAEAAARIPEDGACLLVGVEYNGKIGKEIAFLNWELLDLSKLTVRVATVLDATQGDVHSPGNVLTDGRKGRD